MANVRWWAVLVGALVAAGCGDDQKQVEPLDPLDPVRAQPVVNRYAQLVYENYSDVVARAQALKSAVDAFVAEPTDANLQGAKAAWLASRDSYGQSEAFRFYEGPIDNEDDGPEGRINAWPLDEAYIDYVADDETAGIINAPEDYPEITEELLADRNERDGETNISTGYHAVEFILWGQDLSSVGPGARPYTDFVDGGTAQNQGRRRQYLQVVTGLLLKDLQSVQAQWAEGAENYRAAFVASEPREALLKMITGMGSLNGAELAGERMNVAYENRSQEDEHSCFSDNTLADIRANAQGIENVYLGRYGAEDGPGIDELVQAVNPDLDAHMKEHLASSATLIQAIPAPFDQALQGADESEGRSKIRTAVGALRHQTETLVEVASALGISLNLEDAP